VKQIVFGLNDTTYSFNRKLQEFFFLEGKKKGFLKERFYIFKCKILDLDERGSTIFFLDITGAKVFLAMEMNLNGIGAAQNLDIATP